MNNNYERLPRNYTLLADAYEYFMSDVYVKTKKGVEGIFDGFFRVVPNGGGYAVMAGMDKLIPFIQNLKITKEDIELFKKKGYKFNDEFINYMLNFKFTGDIYAIPDGTPIFPNEPIITVKAPLMEAQMIETAILAIYNGAISHSTGARRIYEATPKNVPIMEFGARRADGFEAGIDASIYGIMAGCVGTSNMFAANMLDGVTALGTMAHSFVETSDDELSAFKDFAGNHPENATLLVDTYDTLRSGVPNAIKTFDWMKSQGLSVDHIGIRIDSGDLAYLSKEARRMLDEAGYPQAKICLSNGLKAETIESLVNQGACFNSLGVGDNISKPEGNVGCVYKEVAIVENGEVKPKIKVSGDLIKLINPGYKELYRAFDNESGYAIADIMCLKDKELDKDNLRIVSVTDLLKNSIISNYRLEKLQKPIFLNGKLVYEDSKDIFEKQRYCHEQMEKLYPEVKRILNPHGYYVDGTEEYVEFKQEMIKKMKYRG
ncbi:MAG: nicotinate phosphoribosyltransferase [Bacilli bacterium]|nr:nicotinate phosphoribosyltransferase [Bacilli bacterium]